MPDRPGYQRFAGPTLADAMPGRNTLWGIRKKLRGSRVLDRLFALFGEALRGRGLLPKDGHVVAPRSSKFPS